MKPSEFMKKGTGTFCLEDLEELDKRFIDVKEVSDAIDKCLDKPFGEGLKKELSLNK